jgi:ribosomal protein L6P/L9E
LDISLYQEILSGIDYSTYKDKSVIIKGCSKKPVPMSAYIEAAKNLQPFAKSIMYGEACSAVPLYKASKK